MSTGLLHPDHFLKVPSSSASTSGAAVFVPAWKFQADNLAVDAQSLREFTSHVVPPAVAGRIKGLSHLEAKRARLLTSFWDFALQCDEQTRTESLMSQVRENSGIVQRQESEVLELKRQVQALEEEKILANEARAKAEAELEAVRQRATALEAEKSAVVAEGERLKSRFDDLSTDLASAKKEITDLEVAVDLNLKDYNEIQVRNVDLATDLERLRKGIPDIVKRAIASDSVTAPFKELLVAVQEVEALRTVDLFVEHIENLPDPLPEAILSKINPECQARMGQASEAVQSLTIPFIERIGSEEPLSVDEILGMRP